MVETVFSDILLRVPARAPYARVVRMGAAALALRQGLSFGEIDDLRLMIDEAMLVLLDGIDGINPIDIDVVFRMTEDYFEVEAARTEGVITGNGVSKAAVQRFEAIARDLVDDYDIEPDRGWLRLRKIPVGEPDA